MLGPSSLTPAALPQPPSAFPVAGRLTAHTPCDPQRAEVERCIRQTYAQRYGALVPAFAPVLLALREGGQVLAAAGYRRAADRPLFLESYLEAPVEQLIAAQAGCPVARTQIVEVGHLAALRRGDGLDQVVVGPCVQPGNALLHRIARGEHQDRQLQARLAPALQPLHAIAPRQTQVQHHGIEGGAGQRGIGCGAMLEPVDGMAALAQPLCQGVTKQAVIFNNHQAHSVASRGAGVPFSSKPCATPPPVGTVQPEHPTRFHPAVATSVHKAEPSKRSTLSPAIAR